MKKYLIMKLKNFAKNHMAGLGLFCILFLCSQALTSCIKDEAPNMECDIVSAWVEGEQFAQNFYQPSQMKVENIPSSEKEITFTVRSLISLPKQLPLYFALTPGATIEPANGSMQDFTAGPVVYTLTSEDGAWKRQYTVVFKELGLPGYKFSFENVETLQASNKNSYHLFYEFDGSGTRQNIWASGNEGVAIVSYNKPADDFPTRSVADGYEGKGVCLSTQYAGDLGKMMKKPIAAGNLFLGKFNIGYVLTNPLMATEFGTPIDKVPVRVTGYYKYRPGKEFTNAAMEIDPSRTDEADAYAVFFRNSNEEGKEVKLHGDDVLSSPYIVRKARVASLPATDEWTRFEMFFEGDDADEELLKSGGYYMTLVFSSSKEGANFEGAIGSTLYIDEVEISFENED